MSSYEGSFLFLDLFSTILLRTTAGIAVVRLILLLRKRQLAEANRIS